MKNKHHDKNGFDSIICQLYILSFNQNELRDDQIRTRQSLKDGINNVKNDKHLIDLGEVSLALWVKEN